MANTQHPNAPQPNNGNAKPVAPGVELITLPKERVEYLAETYDLKPPQVLVVRNAICVGANDAELEFFLATCKRLQLDPFARQIWFVKRRQKIEDHFGNESWVDVGRPETGIDGYRTVAERTGEYEGQAPMQWCGPDGKWREVWIDDEKPPAAAKATIFRKGFREPLVSVAVFREYCPLMKSGAPMAMWRRMPANQIAKCAEAGGFRRAFPRDLSGITTDTEMEAVDVAGAGSFSAPALPAQATKQIEEKKASVVVPASVEQREPVTSGGQDRAAANGELAATFPRDTTKQGDGTPAGATAAAHNDTAALIASLAKSDDEIDREMAKLVAAIVECKTRGEIGDAVGEIISKARLEAKDAKARGVEPDGYTNAVLDIVEPQLQKRWRELPPTTKRGGR